MNDSPDFELVVPKMSGPGRDLIPDPSLPAAVRLRAWSPDAAAFIRDHELTAVQIANDWRGGDRLDFLVPFASQIRRLSVATEIADLSAVADLAALEHLSVAGAIETIDFARLHRLRDCLLGPARSVGNVAAAPVLETLWIERVPLADLAPLAGAPALAKVTLSETRRLRTLDGAAMLPLRRLAVRYSPRLTTLGDLAASSTLEEIFFEATSGVTDVERLAATPSLTKLDLIGGPRLPGFEWMTALPNLRQLGVQGTRAIDPPHASIAPLARLSNLRVLLLRGDKTELRSVTDVEHLGELVALEKLALGRLSPIPSLGFLRTMRSLRDVLIERTPIVDRDLSPLLDLPLLDRVTVDPPRSGRYSHTSEELRAALRARRPELPVQKPSMHEQFRAINAARRAAKRAGGAR